MIMPLTAEQRAHLAGRRVVASISGGKDSTALSLWLTSNGIEHERVFCDTGWEHPETYRYLREVLEPRLGPIAWIQPKRGFADLVRHKGMFPSRLRRFCTQELKVYPLIAHFEERLERGEDCANAIGIRAGESEARSKMTEWSFSPDFPVETWRPLLRWSEADVIATLRAHDCPPNPLYLRGASRVGCWPCIFARKSELAALAKQHPERIDQLRALEAEVAEAARLRAAGRGEELQTAPAFFQARTPRAGLCWPIDRVIRWATDGGRQIELFDDPNPGCARWGLCETAGAEP